MWKFIIGLIILLAVIVGVIVHVKEKKSLSEVLVWIISALTLGADIFGLIVPGANEVFIQSGRDINVAEEQRIINVNSMHIRLTSRMFIGGLKKFYGDGRSAETQTTNTFLLKKFSP